MFQTHCILKRFLVAVLVERVPWYLNINPTSKRISHLMRETKDPKGSQIVTLRLRPNLSALLLKRLFFFRISLSMYNGV